MALCRFCLSCLFGGLNSRNLISTLKGVDNLLFLAFGRSSPMLSWYHGRAWGSKGEMFIQIYIYIYIYIYIHTYTHTHKTSHIYARPQDSTLHAANPWNPVKIENKQVNQGSRLARILSPTLDFVSLSKHSCEARQLQGRNPMHPKPKSPRRLLKGLKLKDKKYQVLRHKILRP